MSIINENEHTADVYTVEGGIEVRTEGMNEPALFLEGDIDNVVDAEGDLWKHADYSGLYYLPNHPYDETPEQADTTLEEIEEEYGLSDVNVNEADFKCACEYDVSDDETTEPVNTEPLNDDPLYEVGDVLINRLSGREALVLASEFSVPLGVHVYTVIEKGYRYPKGCSPKFTGAGTFPESVLAPSGQPPMTPVETLLLALVYTA